MPRRAMVPADLRLVRWPQDAQLSPDASRVAWCEVSPDLERDEAVTRIMVAPADGSDAPRQFTHGPHDFSPRWSPDGRYLAFLAASDGPPALHLAHLQGGLPVKVEAPGPVTWIEWSPDGKRLVLVVRVTDRPEGEPAGRAGNAARVVRGTFNRFDGVGWFEGRRHLFVHDVGSGEVRQLTSGEYDHDQPNWSPDGSTIVFLSDRSQRRDDREAEADVWTVPVDGGRRRRLTRGLLSGAFPTFSPDGSRVAVAGVPGPGPRAGRDLHVLVVDADGTGEPERVAPKLDRPSGFTFSPRPLAWLSRDELLFTVVDRGTIGIRRARLSEAGARSVVEGDLQASGVATAGTGSRRRLAYVAGWVDAPGEVYCRDLAKPASASPPVQVSNAGGDLLRTVELLPAARLTARASDGLEVEYFALRPSAAGRRARKPPLYLEIHGGPELYNPIFECFPMYQTLAAAGYHVVMPNPRGSIGYGADFTSRVRGDWGGGDFGDLLACVDDALARGDADPRRQFVGGYSYGGFMSAWTVGHTERFGAACIGAPIVDQVSGFGTSDVGGFLADSMAGDPWMPTGELRYRSPLTHAPQVATPVLLHVNEGDLRCPPSQADQFFVALKWLGKEVEYVRYPGGSHDSYLPVLGAPSQCEDRARRILEFLARHGGPGSRSGGQPPAAQPPGGP